MIGCGPGEWANAVARDYPRLAVVGVDINETMINYASACARAQRRPNVSLLLDTWSSGDAGIVDLLLASLSRLSGIEYRRDLLNIGEFTFSVNPRYERVAAAVTETEPGMQPKRSVGTG